MIRIITDSGADITLEEAARIGVDVVPLQVLFEDGPLEWASDPDFSVFYARLKAAKVLPKTSQASPEAFAEVYRDVAAKGDTAVAIMLSSGVSGQYQSAVMAKELVPEANVHVIDSLFGVAGEFAMVERAVRLRDEGASIETIIQEIEGMIERVRLFAAIKTLKYLAMGGRMPKAAAVTGELLGIRPILELKDGVLRLVGKARKAQGLLKFFEEGANCDPDFPIYISYAGQKDEAEELMQTVREKYGITNVRLRGIGSVIGVHAGPGTVALTFVRKR